VRQEEFNAENAEEALSKKTNLCDLSDFSASSA
jgi:hypothetical protein